MVFVPQLGDITVSRGGVSGFPTTNKTIYSSAGDTSFVVPAGIEKLGVKMWGAAGAGGADGGSGGIGAPGGAGSFIQCVLDVTPGETLTLRVGDRGDYSGSFSTGGVGGNPDGGDGGSGSSSSNGSGGGGGASSRILRGSTTLACAAGGAGGAGAPNSPGTVKRGGAGDNNGEGNGVGSTQAGGVGGIGNVGRQGNGSTSEGTITKAGSGDTRGGGGGGGLYPGGGGGNSTGGGGGRSYIEPTATHQKFVFSSGFTEVAPNTSDPDYASPAAVGGLANNHGNHGRIVLTY